MPLRIETREEVKLVVMEYMSECFVSSCLASSTQSPLWTNYCCLVAKSCPTLCNPMDYVACQAPLPISQLKNIYLVSSQGGAFHSIGNWDCKEVPETYFFGGVFLGLPTHALAGEPSAYTIQAWRRLSEPINVPSHLTSWNSPTQPHLLPAGPMCSCELGGRLWPSQQSGLLPLGHDIHTHSSSLPWVWTPSSPQLSAQAVTWGEARGPSGAIIQQTHSLKRRYLVCSHLSSSTCPWAPTAKSTSPSIVRSWPPLSDCPKYWSLGEICEPVIRWR